VTVNKTQIIKGVAAVVVGWTTSATVKEIIKNNTDPDKVADKAAVAIASYVLGAIAADSSKNWTDAKIDELILWWTENVSDRLHK
jgi:hypothetical protein